MSRVLFAAALLLCLACCGRDPVSSDTADDLCGERDTNPTSEAEGREAGRQQHSLRSDVEAVHSYGEAHADEFTSHGFINQPSVKIFAYFTARLDEHGAALRQLMEHPDALELRQSVQSKQQVEAMMESLREEPWQLLTRQSGPRSNGAVGVDFRATRAGRDAAQRWLERSADVSCITIGGHPYPKGVRPDVDLCRQPESHEPNPDVAVALTLDAATLARGELGSGMARLTNRGSAPVTVDTNGQVEAVIVDPGTTTMVGQDGNRFRILPLVQFTASPGQSVDIPIHFGTDDCRENSDYALEAGTYGVRVLGWSAEAALTIVED